MTALRDRFVYAVEAGHDFLGAGLAVVARFCRSLRITVALQKSLYLLQAALSLTDHHCADSRECNRSNGAVDI